MSEKLSAPAAHKTTDEPFNAGTGRRPWLNVGMPSRRILFVCSFFLLSDIVCVDCCIKALWPMRTTVRFQISLRLCRGGIAWSVVCREINKRRVILTQINFAAAPCQLCRFAVCSLLLYRAALIQWMFLAYIYTTPAWFSEPRTFSYIMRLGHIWIIDKGGKWVRESIVMSPLSKITAVPKQDAAEIFIPASWRGWGGA